MRKLTLAGLLLCAIVIFGVLVWYAAGTTVPVIDSNKQLKLNETPLRLRAIEVEALAGSIEAANALMDYHSKCHIREGLSPDTTPKKFNQCADRVGFWTDIALENGSAPAAQRHINALLETSKCHDIYRAEFWFRRVQSYYRHDKVLLRSISEQIAEEKRNCIW